MTKRLEDKIAVVSGIGSGIAKATALRFAEEGATVIGSDINADAAKDTAREASERGLEVRAVAPVDMFDEAAVIPFINDVGKEFGRIDVLVNAAATADFAPIEEMSLDGFRRTMVGEVDTIFIVCKAAWPHLKVRGGSIINFSSVASRMAVDVLPGLAHCAGKGAVMAMTRQLALEGAKHGIRANSIAPGFTLTGGTEMAITFMPEVVPVLKAKVMLDRFGTPEDIAAGCLFLASDEASWVTGADLPIDGGMTAW